MNRFLLAVCTLLTALPSWAAEKPKPAPEAPAPSSRAEREQLKQEILEQVRPQLEKNQAELRNEIRTQIANQAAAQALDESFTFSTEKKKLELFTVDGYFRLRPELFYKFAMGRGVDPSGEPIYPYSLSGKSKTLAAANMRWRLDPTLNVAEPVRIKAQIDFFDNLVLGSTPLLRTGDVSTDSEIQKIGEGNLLQNVLIRRAWGEVSTPIGEFSFGRMGSQWGLGMLANSGNCLECDFGDTVDRIMLVMTNENLRGWYVVPMIDFVAEGPVALRTHEMMGQAYDRDQLDDATDWGIIVARRDKDREIERKLGAGQTVVNYGLYFTYRTQSWDTLTVNDATTTYPRKAGLYVPDLWFKFQTPKLKLEAELAGVFGTIGTMAPTAGSGTSGNQEIDVLQFGLVTRGTYEATKGLDLKLEVGLASGDEAPGMGNRPGLGKTEPGSIDGAQFCVDAGCTTRDNKINNFRFNRAYQVDMILWRELLMGVTDAIYVKPGFEYEFLDDFSVWSSFIYSRAMESTSVPGSHLDNGKLVGDPNLGIELNAGLRYKSGDGFQTSLTYGVLFPLGGLDNYLSDGTVKSPTAAQAIRAMFAITY